MSSQSNSSIKYSTRQNLAPSAATPLSFFLTWRYQVFLPFSARQMDWLQWVLPNFEREVLEDTVDTWLHENTDSMYCDAEEYDDIRDQKVVYLSCSIRGIYVLTCPKAILQIFTMYLELKWHTEGGLPESLGTTGTCEKIVGLHMTINAMTDAT
ncbi:uncharacterized protein ARMOST_20335 [Armillaria ostoyae]|uniref:Uncharacterized protein n=1 Tax=Armillaria ostoyae TaxID=47428 RepID=A0A284S762_ARMOS|nr:uncharacterized protein ARMOST_20335 [Armillaria ostoyae]